jgi:hypothetical protein
VLQLPRGRWVVTYSNTEAGGGRRAGKNVTMPDLGGGSLSHTVSPGWVRRHKRPLQDCTSRPTFDWRVSGYAGVQGSFAALAAAQRLFDAGPAVRGDIDWVSSRLALASFVLTVQLRTQHWYRNGKGAGASYRNTSRPTQTFQRWKSVLPLWCSSRSPPRLQPTPRLPRSRSRSERRSPIRGGWNEVKRDPFSSTAESCVSS